METITDKQLKNLPVEDKNGRKIGKIAWLELELDSQNVVNYIVKPNQVIKGIFQGNLVISRDQVIELRTDKLIIEDNKSLTKDKSPELASLAN